MRTSKKADVQTPPTPDRVTDADRALMRLLARRCVERWVREQNLTEQETEH